MPAVISEFFKTIHSYFLWRNVKGLSSHINLLVNIHTGDDKEDPRPPGSSCQEPAQSEDDGSLVLLDHLHHEEEGEREGDEDDEDRDEGDHVSTEAGALTAVQLLAGRRRPPFLPSMSGALAGLGLQQGFPDGDWALLGP